MPVEFISKGEGLISNFIVFLPPLSSNCFAEARGFSSSGRASGSQSEGGRFESGNLHTIKRNRLLDFSGLFLLAREEIICCLARFMVLKHYFCKN